MGQVFYWLQIIDHELVNACGFECELIKDLARDNKTKNEKKKK